MYFALRLLPIAALLLLAACGSDEEQTDPCHGVTCPAGFDCRAGQCVEREPEPEPGACEVNSDCPSSVAPFCDRGAQACVACLDDDHCMGRSCVAGACVGSVCSSDDACGGDTPFCNRAGDACVACRDGGDCATGEACEAGACVAVPVACESDAECEEQAPTRPLCQAQDGRGLCVECRRAADCAGGVDCLGGSCVDLGCGSADDCAAFPDRQLCGSEGRCVGCEEDGDCAAGSTCVAELCLAQQLCDGNDDCAGDPGGPICDPGTGACVPCVADGDCALGERCEERRACVAVACGDSRDCPLGARCDDGSCVDPGACTESGDCAFDPRAPWCNGGGRCVECTADAHCGAGERCIAEACTLPQECNSDAQCGGGYVCSGGLCGACRTDDQCPRGTCSAGACVNQAICESDLDCATGVCAGGVCAACATTLDCAAGLWCEAGACVQPPSCTGTADCGPGSSCTGGVCSAPACAGDEEPNDHPTEATPFTPGAPLSRTLCANDADWYVFSAGKGATLNASLLAPPAGTTLTLAWYDPETRALRTQAAIGGRLLVPRLEGAAQGRYFLAVEAAGDGGSYGLLATVTSSATSCTDVLEPNDDRHEGNPRPVEPGKWLEGLMLCGDDDFFQLEVPAGAVLRAYAFPEGGADLGFEIFTTTGQRLATSTTHDFLGGGRTAVVPGDTSGARTMLVKVSKPAPVQLRYALYFSIDVDPTCAGAPSLFGGGDRARIEGTTLGRSADLGAGACGAGGPDVAYRVEVPTTRRFVAQVRGPFPARLALRSASCAGPELGCAAAVAEGAGTLDVPSLPAGSYTLVVGGAPGTAGPFELAAQLLAPIAAPGNDACVDAAAIAADGSVISGTTRGAVRHGSLSCAPGAPEVYYEFALASAARVVIDLQASGAASLALLGPGDCATERSCAPAATRTRIDQQLAAGTWRIAVAAASGAPVDFTLQVSQPQPVAGDQCAAAPVIALGSTVAGDSTWAANDLEFPLATSCTGYYTGGPDVFHPVVLAAGQSVTATVTPAQGFDAALYVIDSCGAAQCLAGADAALEGGVETLRFTAPAAGAYVFVVDGSSGGGSYTLKVQ